MSNNFWTLILVSALNLGAGLLDAAGFTWASKIWSPNGFDRGALAISAAGFASGISLYWISLRWANQLGWMDAELQTIIWFSVTICGVAILNGKFIHWPRIDQTVAVIVMSGLVWLTVRQA